MPKSIVTFMPSNIEIPPWMGDIPEARAFQTAQEKKDEAIHAFLSAPSQETHDGVGKALSAMVDAGNRLFSIPQPTEKEIWLSWESLPLSIATVLLLLLPLAVSWIIGGPPPWWTFPPAVGCIVVRFGTGRRRSLHALTRIMRRKANAWRAEQADKTAKEIQRETAKHG